MYEYDETRLENECQNQRFIHACAEIWGVQRGSLPLQWAQREHVYLFFFVVAQQGGPASQQGFVEHDHIQIFLRKTCLVKALSNGPS